MPDGNDNNNRNKTRPPWWCNERHKAIDERFEKMEARYNAIILLLIGNLGIGLTVGALLVAFRGLL